MASRPPIHKLVNRLAAGLIACAALIWTVPPATAQGREQRVGGAARQSVALTVYQQDLALIDERRRVRLDAGRNLLAFEDVGTALLPGTVSLRGAGVRVVEQVFAADVLTPRRLLEAALGQEVRLVRSNPQTGEETVERARLLSISEGPVLQIGARIETAPPGRIVFERLPEGVRARPTLLAVVDSARAGDARLALGYLSGGLSWRADYVAETGNDGNFDLTGYITVTNNSGVSFADAALRVVAGEVNRVADARSQRRALVAMEADTAAAFADGPRPQPAADRYLYALERPVSLADRETKRFTLLRATGLGAQREYRFEALVNARQGADDIGPLQAVIGLKIDNTAAAGLGRPLPGGVVRVYEAAAGGPVFTGEDRIRHTALGAPVELRLGRAFDVTGSARRTAFERLSNRAYETAQEIVVRNAKDVPVDVRLIGHMPPGWKMLRESAAHVRETANRIAWTISVPAQGRAVLSYRARISQ